MHKAIITNQIGDDMELQELAKMIRKDIEIKYMPSWRNTPTGYLWYCAINGIETKDSKDSITIGGVFGRGKTPRESVDDYCLELSGKIAVIDSRSADRKEYDMPEFVTCNYESLGL